MWPMGDADAHDVVRATRVNGSQHDGRHRSRCYDPPRMSATRQRAHWNGQPTHVGDLFRVHKMRGDKRLGAACQLWTHALGGEVRLEVNGDLQRSEVFRSHDDVLTAAERGRPRWARRGGAPDRPSFRFTFKVAAFGGVLTERRAVFLAEPRLKHAQCFTGNGHRRSARHAHTNDDVGKVGSLLELVNTTNRTSRKDLTGCAGVVGNRGQTVDSWPGLRQTQDVPRVAVRV
jgi:hypothetical protein